MYMQNETKTHFSVFVLLSCGGGWSVQFTINGCHYANGEIFLVPRSRTYTMTAGLEQKCKQYVENELNRDYMQSRLSISNNNKQ